MPVPLLQLNGQNLPLEAELQAAFNRVLRSGHFIMGADVQALEEELAGLTGCKYNIGVSSGTDAILLALMALGIGPGAEVLCPSFTFFATAGCIARTGAKPVFVDSCPVCFNIDIADARRKVTGATRGIVPVHLFGQAAEMDSVLGFAREFGLHVIEDAAQALGAEYKNRRVGSMGVFGTYSFFPTKNLGALGDAGLLATNDEAAAAKARMLRNHGMQPKYYHKLVGGNFRIDTLQAAFLRVKLPHYARYTEQRRANAQYYAERLSEIPGVRPGATEECCSAASRTTSSAKAIFPAAIPGRAPIWNQFTLRFPAPGGRDRAREILTKKGIGTEIYYPVPLHQQECFAQGEGEGAACPIAEKLAREVLSIPIFPELRRAELEEVVGALRHAIAGLD